MLNRLGALPQKAVRGPRNKNSSLMQPGFNRKRRSMQLKEESPNTWSDAHFSYTPHHILSRTLRIEGAVQGHGKERVS